MPRSPPARPALAGASVVITRPVGQGATLARRVRALGGQAVLLPGLSLFAAPLPAAARRSLQAALGGDAVIFTSPAAVRFAARLAPLQPASGCRVCAVGRGTARALRHQGLSTVAVPDGSQDSEGLLAHPVLARPRGWQVHVVGAPGGRGLLQDTLRARGAHVHDVHVYRRAPARLDRRHREALRHLHGQGYALLSSVAALRNLRQALAGQDWQHFTACVAIASSERLARAAGDAGFEAVHVARSALDADLLACTLQVHAERAR